MWKRIDSAKDLPRPLIFVPIVLETPYGHCQLIAMWTELADGSVAWVNATDRKQLTANVIAWYEVPKYE